MECPVNLESAPLFQGFMGGNASPLTYSGVEDTMSASVVQRLLDIGADPMELYKNNSNVNALVFPAHGSDMTGEKIRVLVASPRQDLHWKDTYGQNYVHNAAYAGNVVAIEIFCELGLDFNARATGTRNQSLAVDIAR